MGSIHFFRVFGHWIMETSHTSSCWASLCLGHCSFKRPWEQARSDVDIHVFELRISICVAPLHTVILDYETFLPLLHFWNHVASCCVVVKARTAYIHICNSSWKHILCIRKICSKIWKLWWKPLRGCVSQSCTYLVMEIKVLRTQIFWAEVCAAYWIF